MSTVFPRPAHAGADLFVGRDTELAILRAAAERARGETASVALITGPTGIGKTALVHRFLSQTPGFVTFTAVASSSELALPYALVEQLLAAIPGGAAAVDRSGLPATGSPFAVGATLVQKVEQLPSGAPIALVLDNMHWADPESVAALRFMARRLHREPVLIVAVGRDHHGDWDSLDGAAWPVGTERTVLRGLSGPEVRTLAKTAERGLSHWTLRRLHEQTEGNPLYLRSVLADPGAFQSYLFGRARMPRSLATAVSHVLSAASAPQRELLAALTVMADPTPRRTLAALTRLVDIDAVAGPLVDRGLVEWQFDHGAERLAFCSVIYRDAMYAGLDMSTRRALHRAAADVSIGQARWRHLVAATDDDPTLAEELLQAAEDELTRDNPILASTYLLWAARITTDPQQTARDLTEAVRLLVYAGREGHALQHETAIEGLPHSTRRTEVLGLLAFARGRVATARDLLTEALAQAHDDIDIELTTRINVELAYVCSLLGLGRPAASAALEALTTTEQSPSQINAARAFLAAGTALRTGPSAGLAQLDDLPAEPTACATQQLAPLTQRGLLRGLMGQLDLAVADLAVVVGRRDPSLGQLLGVSAHIHLVWCHYLTGSWDAAQRTLAVAFDAAAQHGRSFDHAALHSLSAILHAGRGEHELADADLQQAVRLSDSADYLGPMVHLNLARAAIAQAADRPGDVVGALADLTPLSTESDRIQLYSVWWLPALCDAQIATGQLGRAERTLNALRAIDTDGNGCWDVAAAHLNARLVAARGDTDAARAEYEVALTLADHSAPQALGRALLNQDYGTFLASCGEGHAAVAALEIAADLYRRIGAVPFADRCAAAISRIDPAATSADTWMAALTDRERETATLVGRGWTTREIATEHFVSAKTTEYHLRNIYMKLNITGRRELRNLVQHGRTSNAS